MDDEPRRVATPEQKAAFQYGLWVQTDHYIDGHGYVCLNFPTGCDVFFDPEFIYILNADGLEIGTCIRSSFIGYGPLSKPREPQ